MLDDSNAISFRMYYFAWVTAFVHGSFAVEFQWYKTLYTKAIAHLPLDFPLYDPVVMTKAKVPRSLGFTRVGDALCLRGHFSIDSHN